MNERLGNIGEAIETIEPVAASAPAQWTSISELAGDMHAGRVDVLFVLESNPVYDAPAELDFAAALERVPHAIHLGLYDDETAHLCRWHVPAAHYLEAWGDVRSGDGTVSLQQPLIAPLYQGKSTLEILALALGLSQPSGYAVLREHWKNTWETSDFEARWQRALRDGTVAGSRSVSRRFALRSDLGGALRNLPKRTKEGLEVAYRMHPTVGDGRFANNGWLQECPTPLAKLTWDNVVLLAPSTAEQLDVQNGDLLEVTTPGGRVEGPAWILPGQTGGKSRLAVRVRPDACGQRRNEARLQRVPSPHFDGPLVRREHWCSKGRKRAKPSRAPSITEHWKGDTSSGRDPSRSTIAIPRSRNTWVTSRRSTTPCIQITNTTDTLGAWPSI